LSQRKQALIVESNLNRIALQTEWENLRAATRPLHQAAAVAHRMGPWLLPLAPLAGFLAAGFLRKRSGFLGTVTSLLRSLPSVLALWQQFRRPAGDQDPRPDAG
jgi:hypothetical protein